MEFVFLNGVTLLDCILRITAACGCGALIGFERSRRQKEAGIRTHIIVALGAALMMVVSKYGFFDITGAHMAGFSGDRVAANIITGVSFLGAGMIFFKGSSVKGLTTAAGIWTTAGVGLAMGAGMYIIAAISTLLILLIQVIFHKWHIGADDQIYGTAVVVLERDESRIDFIESTLTDEGIDILSNKIEWLGENKVQITYLVRSKFELTSKHGIRISMAIPELRELEIRGDV